MAISGSLPMSQFVGEALCAVVADAGEELWQNPRRLRAVLSDRCPADRREVAA
jgi:hypothetical protein